MPAMYTNHSPDDETDSNSSDKNQRRIPEEKGPFGKARKRGTSRAKTPTANSAADAAREGNNRIIDDIFGRYKADEDKKRSIRGASGAVAALPQSASVPNLIDAGGLSQSYQAGASANAGAIKEPKEVILYGYGADAQWAAISHFEKVSNGIIYEEYDREPYNPKLGISFSAHSAHRGSTLRTLSSTALRKINAYVGGNHWIKVTFDSADAAERACHYSPHSIQGHIVFAEPYRGTGPTGGDRAIRAQVGGALSVTASPNTVSSGTVAGRGPSRSSTTVSPTNSLPASTGFIQRFVTEPAFNASGAFPTDGDETTVPVQSSQALQTNSNATGVQPLGPRSQKATLRLKGANVKPAVFLPQEKAFLPTAPRWQQTVGSLPIIGWVIGSGPGFIGDQMPRKPDGSFDAVSASLYWRAWYAIDACFGTDFCGVREIEYDE